MFILLSRHILIISEQIHIEGNTKKFKYCCLDIYNMVDSKGIQILAISTVLLTGGILLLLQPPLESYSIAEQEEVEVEGGVDTVEDKWWSVTNTETLTDDPLSADPPATALSESNQSAKWFILGSGFLLYIAGILRMQSVRRKSQ